jgi:3-hydroxyisobutyrate dehydrogenase-like beta-hydroxyacid dehydrogenase
METIGFIGVGNMGAPIVKRILAKNIPVLAYDTNAATLARICEIGASAATSIRDVADRTEVIFACLPTAEICKAVALGPDGVAGGRKVKVYVETSTIGSAAADEMAAALAAHGIAYLDAPVIGGAIAAESGTLGVLAAGPVAAFDKARPALEAAAGRLFYLGEKPSMGQVGKVVANAVSYAAFYATMEATAVAMKAGIDIHTAIAIINQGSGGNFHSQKTFPAYILPGKFAGTGAIEIGVKDVKYFLAEARRLNAQTPMAEQVSKLGICIAEAGPPGRDTMTAFHYFCDLAGVPHHSGNQAAPKT